MNHRQAREIQYFLFSEYLSDGLRITLGVLLPTLILAQFNHLETGFTFSLGALCVSITDSPGPVLHKRNAMLLCNICIFVVALITGFACLNPYALGAEILILSFFFSMFMVYGNRAGAVGIAGLLIMIMMMANNLKPEQVLGFSGIILAGGLWYMGLSLLFFRIRPFLPARQALGECIHETAKFLRLKAEFYKANTDLEEDYHKLIAQQILVSEKQDAVREILFKSKSIVKESATGGRVLILTFVDLIDLYERATAIHYDYAFLRQQFGHTAILENIGSVITTMGDVLDNIGFSIQSNLPYKNQVDLTGKVEELKRNIDLLSASETESSTLVLKKILINIRNLSRRINNILEYFNANYAGQDTSTSHLEYSRFVSHQDLNPKKFKDNLTLDSTIFKHSVRVALVSLFGYVLTQLLPYGQHGYWVLLTIIVILKPGFSLTKQRNYERIVGTLAGGLIGLLILLLIKNTVAQFVFLVFFMVGTYSFQRRNYIVSVFFMTPFILILFKFLGVGQIDLVEERIIDTLIGSAIAFVASYLIFPSWESEQLLDYLPKVLRANINYLHLLTESLLGKQVPVPEYRLARKEVYVTSANLSAAFQRMVSEPKSKQKHRKEIHKFMVLNHMLSAYIATITATLLNKERALNNRVSLRPLRRALTHLNESLKKLDPAYTESVLENLPSEIQSSELLTRDSEEKLLQEQFDFMQKVSADITKITDTILSNSDNMQIAK